MSLIIAPDRSVAASRRSHEKRNGLLSSVLVWRDQIELWRGRVRQRRALADLDDRLLDDIGVSREQALQEAAKPFWTS